MPGLQGRQFLDAYRLMLRIRRFEERVREAVDANEIPGVCHEYIGQEAVAVGVCMALRPDDVIASTHRGHGHMIAKGGDVRRMMAELFGKADGYNRGKGGSMHIADQETGNLGANAIVGGSAGIATGAGLSIKMRKSDQVAVCFFGDGALGQGLIYESMNMAQLWNLPVIYVCENNQYNEYTHNSETAAGSLVERGRAFGLHSVEVDGQDVRAVYTAMTELVARARRGEGPAYMVCHTYRFHGHHVGDIDRSYYRSRDEEQWWRARDPLRLLADWLTTEAGIAPDILQGIDDSVRREVDEAVEYALNAPYPAADEVDDHVYA